MEVDRGGGCTKTPMGARKKEAFLFFQTVEKKNPSLDPYFFLSFLSFSLTLSLRLKEQKSFLACFHF